MSAASLIRLSVREDRIVTEYPSSLDDERTLVDGLLSAGDYEDCAEVSGEGYSGPEARGFTEFWGASWRVHVVHSGDTVEVQW